VSLNKLREMAELFKTEMDDMTRHVRSIELHILDSYVRAGLMQMAPFPTTKAPFAQPRQPSSPPQAGQSESSVSPLGMNRQPISPAAKSSLPFVTSVSKFSATVVRAANGSHRPIPHPIHEENFSTLSGTFLDGGQGRTGDPYEQRRINSEHVFSDVATPRRDTSWSARPIDSFPFFEGLECVHPS